MWIKASSYRGEPIANGRAYLFRMANNLVLDRRRSERRAMLRSGAWLTETAGDEVALDQRPDPSERADASLARKQEEELLRGAISALPPGARRALLLYRIEERSHGEIAQIMGISRSGVEKHLALAMRRLRAALVDCGYFGPVASVHDDRRDGDAQEPTR